MLFQNNIRVEKVQEKKKKKVKEKIVERKNFRIFSSNRSNCAILLCKKKMTSETPFQLNNLVRPAPDNCVLALDSWNRPKTELVNGIKSYFRCKGFVLQ